MARSTGTDWFARWMALLSLALALAGFGWGIYTYQLDNRPLALVRISTLQEFPETAAIHLDWDHSRWGMLKVEIVNVGRRSFFVGGAQVLIGSERFGLAPAGLAFIEPGQGVTFESFWNFEKHPLDNLNSKRGERGTERYEVVVMVDNEEIARKTGITSMEFTSAHVGPYIMDPSLR